MANNFQVPRHQQTQQRQSSGFICIGTVNEVLMISIFSKMITTDPPQLACEFEITSPDSKVGWVNVGPTSVLLSWRWANLHCCLGGVFVIRKADRCSASCNITPYYTMVLQDSPIFATQNYHIPWMPCSMLPICQWAEVHVYPVNTGWTSTDNGQGMKQYWHE